MTKIKISNLDSLRGIAALTVVLYHFQIGSELTNNSFISHGHSAVNFFFILSGFVIAENYINKFNSLCDILNFQIKRFWRLYPVHLFVLTLYLILEIAKLYFVNYTGIIPTELPFDDDQSLMNFIESIFLFQNVLDNDFVWNRPAWSISVEFYTYLLFGLIILLFKDKSVYVFISITVYFYLSKTTNFDYFNNLNIIFDFLGLHFKTCITAFSLGVIVNLIYKKCENVKIHEIFCWISLIIVIFVTSNLETSLSSIRIGNKFIGEQISYTSFCLLIFFSSKVKVKSKFTKLLNLKIFQFLGNISYSLYMIHFLVAYIIKQILRFMFDVNIKFTEEGTAAKLDLLKSQAYFVTIIYLIVSVTLSYYIYKFIENRFRKY